MHPPPTHDALAFWREITSLAPNWSAAHEQLADTCINHQQVERGLDSWRDALNQTPQPDAQAFLDAQRENYWTDKVSWNAEPRDRFRDLYNRSVDILHRGDFDAHLDILKIAIDQREKFAKDHQLDRLGIKFLREWTYAIGHTALLDMYAKMGILGLRADHQAIVLEPKPANPHYLSYWKEYFPAIITNSEAISRLTPLAERLEEHLHLVSFKDGSQRYLIDAHCYVESLWQNTGRPALLKLKEQDRERGWEVLKKFAVPQDAWFVGLHLRDTRGENNRDCKIDSYRQAIETIAEHGGWTIRMGDKSMPKAPNLPNFIDYVHTDYHSDWMDVFLWGASRFYLGTNSGPVMVPPTFGVPCIITNISPVIAPIAVHTNMALFKLYWSTQEKRYLTFTEAFASPVGLSEQRARWEKLGIEIHDNTADEINAAVLEMLARIDGTWQDSTTDQELQKQFKSLRFKSRHAIGASNGYLSSSFARKHQLLLATKE